MRGSGRQFRASGRRTFCVMGPMHWTSLAIATAVSPDWVGAATQLITAVVGTFAGAFLAFRYETRHRAKQEEATQITKGQQALFTLVAQINTLENLNTQHLAALRNDPGRDLKLLPIAVGHQVPVCDVSSLMFLIRDDAQLLASLLNGQQSIDTLFYTIQERNRYHTEFQDRMGSYERAGGRLPAELTAEILEQVAGKNIVRTLMHLTAIVFDGYEHTREKVHSNFAALRDTLKRRFPDAKFLKFDLIESGSFQQGEQTRISAARPSATREE